MNLSHCDECLDVELFSLSHNIQANKVIYSPRDFYRSLIHYSELAKLFGNSQICGVLHSHRKDR